MCTEPGCNVNGVGDAFDFAAGAIGPRSVHGANAGARPSRCVLGWEHSVHELYRTLALWALGTYKKRRSSAGQYSDPVLAAKPAEQRQAAATTKGLVNAALEGIVPAGLDVFGGQEQPGAYSREGRVRTEGATEAAQQYVGHLAKEPRPEPRARPCGISLTQ